MSLALMGLLVTADLPPGPPAVVDEKESVSLQQTEHVRLSLPTEDDRDAWQSPGLRLQLGYGYTALGGWGPAWSFRSHTVMLRPSVRIDGHWALGVAMVYGTGPYGLRWSVTAEPTFFPWRQLAVSVGLGYGGLDVRASRVRVLGGPGVTVSRTLGDDEKLDACTGSALSSVLRAEYLFVVGPLFASGPFVQANAQWTRCEDSFGQPDPETGRPPVLTQWWRQAGATVGWWLAWR
jgi:hypothetical protein